MLNCAFIISDVTQSIVLQFLQDFLKNNVFGFSVVFSHEIVQISVFKVEYLENGLDDFNDFGLILQDFERPFRRNQLVLALQFSFKWLVTFKFYKCACATSHLHKISDLTKKMFQLVNLHLIIKF